MQWEKAIDQRHPYAQTWLPDFSVLWKSVNTKKAILALKNLGVAFRHAFSSEVNPKLREMRQERFKLDTISEDVTNRDVENMETGGNGGSIGGWTG